MTPLDILDEITEILTGILSGYSDYSGTPYTVYKQNLPDDWDINEDYEGMEGSPEISLLLKRNYPHCLVTIEDGIQDSSQSACDITLFFAVKDESEDRCGYRDIMNVTEAVRQYFVNNRDVRLAVKHLYPDLLSKD